MAKSSSSSSPDATAEMPAASDAFIPQLCTSCTNLEAGCSKLALLREKAPGQEISLCGIYSPITPPATPDKE